ncbi:hypothetical protein GIB67_025670 [Kingdonia uniflora]|uniref:Uncharacterized protein n=1 Tax=Kingdonia uniflora TaxID=39325 RepID=A0A7J7L8H8_9MAGN|nr:hypothetical protein GIB67_025670 [Kingdonia uniflora]
MSSAKEEYDGTNDEEEFEFDEGQCYVSQMRFLSGEKRKITYKELNARVGFKCRSVLVKLRKMYLILIKGVVIDWEDNEGEVRTSQAGTSRGRGSRGRTSQGGAAPPGDQDVLKDHLSE